MSASSADSQPSPEPMCAEPGCPNEIDPRKGPKTFFLHCEAHRTDYTSLPDDFPEPPMSWGRYECIACGAVFEKYKSMMRGTTGRIFCLAVCRNSIGSKPTTYPQQQCEYEGCPRPGRWFQPHTPNRRFCSVPCNEAWKDEQPRTRKRPQTPTAKDWAERLPCAEPGCPNFAEPRDPSNGYRPKRCEEHRFTADRPGRPPVPGSKVEIPCAKCGAPVERYVTNLADGQTVRCTHGCREPDAGTKRVLSSGYVMVYAPGHSMSQANGWAMEHRKIVSDLLGRPLLPSEEVHHRSGERDVNTPDQLVLMTTSHPAGAALQDKIDWCRKFIEENEPVAAELREAGVVLTLDTDVKAAACFDEDGNFRDPDGSSAA